MAQQLTTGRDLARAVLEPGWNVAAFNVTEEQVADALATLDGSSKALKTIEPKLDGPQARSVVDALKPLGIKIAPTMAPGDLQAWLAAMVLALSDLPPRVALAGARKAVHTPMSFLNEVEKAIREGAAEAETAQRLARHRLGELRRALERAKARKLPPPEPRDMTQESINTMPAKLRKLGLTLGHITQEQFDAAEAAIAEARENNAQDAG